MSNKASKRSSALPPSRPRSGSTPVATPARNKIPRSTIMLLGIVVAVVVVGIVIGLIVGRGSDDPSEPIGAVEGVATCTEAAPATGDDLTTDELAEFPTDEITKPVQVTGDALAEYTGDQPDSAACQEVPVLAGYDYAGDSVVIDPATDGPTLVVFLAHWCPHCNNEIPVLNEWRDSDEFPEGLNVVGVSTGVASDRDNYPPDAWLAAKDWTWPVLADDSEGLALQAYGGRSFPTLAFVGSDGLVRFRTAGEIPLEQLTAWVDAALADDPAT